jgi:hypothetical protein
MALNVKIKPEGTTYSELELKSVRVDQRVTVKPHEYERPKKEAVKCRAAYAKRTTLFIITGKATQSEKDDLETASKKWWQEETSGDSDNKGRVRFLWGTNNGSEYYNCAIRKADFTQEAAHEVYDYLIELIECEFG